MKAILLFKMEREIKLVFGGAIQVYMDCYRIPDAPPVFERKFVFSWIAMDKNDPFRRVLMDQHTGRPGHLHIGTENVELFRTPRSVNEARQIFYAEIRRYFGELENK